MFSFRVLESNDKEDASKDARCVSTETVDVTHAGVRLQWRTWHTLSRICGCQVTECGQLQQEFGSRLPSMQ
jgi:extradiol dioxygenase family protein